MKKAIFMILAFAFVSNMASAQKVKQKIKVESSGSWYDATILKIDGDKYFIHYDGWADSWDEWVGKERMKDYDKVETKTPKAPLTKFAVGDKVEVEYGMVLEPATIIEVGENKYHIQYDKKVFGDKWVTEKQIKKL